MRRNSHGVERSSGFTKLQVLLGILVVGTLIGLAIPAVRRMREADARTQSTNHLKELGLAFQAYHDANKHLPWNGSFAAYLPKDGAGEWGGPAKPGDAHAGSWAFQILPHINQKAMFLQGDAEASRVLGIALLMDPGRGRPAVCTEGLEPTMSGGPWSDYALNCWINDSTLGTLSGPSNRRTLVGITDGTSNTILLGQASIASDCYGETTAAGAGNNSDVIWNGGSCGLGRGIAQMAPDSDAIIAGVNSTATTPGGPASSWGGPFANACLMCMADATVRAFPYAVSPGRVMAYLTPTGGETVVLPDNGHTPSGYFSDPAPRRETAEENIMRNFKGGVAKIEANAIVDAPAVPAPAVADPVVGREMPKLPNLPQIPKGVLTAGSFDDNIDPAVFHSFLRRFNQSRGVGDIAAKLNGQRLMILVKDGSGKPVGDARVKLSAGAASPVELPTRSDGRAVFVLPLDQLPADQPLLASVTAPGGGDPVTAAIAVGAGRWEITLPAAKAELPKSLDLAIILDTTGSMQDEIDHLKSEIRGISAHVAKKFPAVKQRFALICYRDDGDDYVVRSFDFTASLDAFHKNIAAQNAAGGGDYPEAMHRGLQEATQLRWQDTDTATARVAFLIADAPPHAQHMNATLAAVNTLRKRGVGIYPVACSGYDDACELVMRSSALLTGSQFLFLTDDSGVGSAHAEPKIPYYQVERLEKLMTRIIAGELAGQRIPPDPAEILRTVGKKVN